MINKPISYIALDLKLKRVVFLLLLLLLLLLCVALNYLARLSKPILTSPHPMNTTALYGDTAVLQCVVNSDVEPTIQVILYNITLQVQYNC